MRCKRRDGDGDGDGGGKGAGGGAGGGALWALHRKDFREVLVRSEASHTLQVARSSSPTPTPTLAPALTLQVAGRLEMGPLTLIHPNPNPNPDASPHPHPHPSPNTKPNLDAAGGWLAQDAASLRATQRRAGAQAAPCNPYVACFG